MEDYVGRCPRCRSGLIKKGDYVVCEKFTCNYSKILKPVFTSKLSADDVHDNAMQG